MRIIIFYINTEINYWKFHFCTLITHCSKRHNQPRMRLLLSRRDQMSIWLRKRVIEYEKEHYPIEKATKSVSIGIKIASHNAVGLLFLSSIRINWLILQIGVGNTIFLLKKSNFWRWIINSSRSLRRLARIFAAIQQKNTYYYAKLQKFIFKRGYHRQMPPQQSTYVPKGNRERTLQVSWSTWWKQRRFERHRPKGYQ